MAFSPGDAHEPRVERVQEERDRAEGGPALLGRVSAVPQVPLRGSDPYLPANRDAHVGPRRQVQHQGPGPVMRSLHAETRCDCRNTGSYSKSINLPCDE